MSTSFVFDALLTFISLSIHDKNKLLNHFNCFEGPEGSFIQYQAWVNEA